MWSAYILSILAFSCSAHYLFAGGWIFLDLWVSSSALLLDCMCFFDFMFPFQVTAFDIWLVLLLSPLLQVVATTNCWKEILNWNWVYPLYFPWGWIFLDLWVSSSALLLDYMCFFDFVFPFQVTAFDVWLVLLLSPLRQVVATTNCWKGILNWNWVYPLSFLLRLNISWFLSVFKRSAPRLHVLLWLHVSVQSDSLRYLTRDAAPSSTSSGRNHIVEKLLSFGIGLIFSSFCFK